MRPGLTEFCERDGYDGHPRQSQHPKARVLQVRHSPGDGLMSGTPLNENAMKLIPSRMNPYCSRHAEQLG